MTTSATRFQLGRFSFGLKTNRTDLLDGFEKVLPRAVNQESGPTETIDLDEPLAIAHSFPDYDPQEDPTIAMHYLIGQAINSHPGCVWIDAAILITPDGRLVMISGPSQAGKTTLALAMTKAYGWKALSEDLMLIDPARGNIIPIVRPSSLRPGCRQLIYEATGIMLDPVILDQWYLDESIYQIEPVSMPVSIAVSLDVIEQTERGILNSRTVPPAHYLRSVLPISSSLRVSGGVEAIEQALRGSLCFSFMGGTVVDRMRELVALSISQSAFPFRSEV